MTNTPETVEELDKGRARAMCLTDEPRCADGCIPMKNGECHYLSYARAIRESDQAASVVPVPVEATLDMQIATRYCCWPYPDIYDDFSNSDTDEATVEILKAALAASPYAEKTK